MNSKQLLAALTATAAILMTAPFAHAKLIAVMADSDAGGTINVPNKGYTGTVDSFNPNTGVIRVRDGAGTITAYSVTSDTEISDGGKTATADQIREGDRVTVYLKAITTTNELKRLELGKS